MSVIERIVLRLAREPLGPYYGGPDETTSLPDALGAAGWKLGDVVIGPRSGARVAVLAITLVASFALGASSAGIRHDHEWFALTAVAGAAIATWAFVQVACGPTARITEQGLELRSATEGAHTIAWASIHGWSRKRHLIVVDLGPRTPLASRCIQIWPR